MESYDEKKASSFIEIPKEMSYMSFKKVSGRNKTEQKNQQKDMSFIENIIFDRDLRFIVGYGKTEFMLYNIQNDESEFYEIPTATYLSIHDMAFTSSSNEDY